MARTDPPVRWGIVATGNISNRFATDLALVDGAEVAAVASRRAETAQAFADRHRIGTAYPSYDALIADGSIDIVYIGTPHPQHYPVARACLLNDKAVLCEKPITLNRRQGAELIELARSRGLLFAEAMWMRCNPVIEAVVADVAAGRIGEPRHVVADLCFTADPLPRRIVDPALGGGALLDLGVYPATFGCLLLGVPTEVRAVAQLNAAGVDLATAMCWRWESGAVGAFSCAAGVDGPSRAAVSGSEGSLLLPPPFQRPDHYLRHLAGDPNGEAERVELAVTGLGYHYEARAVQDAWRAGLIECPQLPHAGTLEVLGVLDQARDQIGVRYPNQEDPDGGDEPGSAA